MTRSPASPLVRHLSACLFLGLGAGAVVPAIAQAPSGASADVPTASGATSAGAPADADGDPAAAPIVDASAEPASGPDAGDAGGDAPPFDRAWLVAEAERLSRSPDGDARMKFEGDYAELDYAGYRDIRFRADARPWQDTTLPFELELLPPGFLFDRPVAIHLVDGGRVVDMPYDPALLETGPLAGVPTNPAALAWTGFRVLHPLNRPDVPDDVAVFQGASYFRAVARDQLYGLSARGLAIDTAEPGGEEFPRFTAFWIERPAPDATSLVVHALLESASVTGAYTFRILPGTETRMDVQATLFPRKDLPHVGIAPLTSMFLYDTTNRETFDDWRDEVHDSDALKIVNGAGERLLRSLSNGRTLQISSFIDTDPKGFGLVQRHRDFADYEDAGARYDLRPSAWVEPRGAWGPGRVELVEIPSREEIHDNIVAYWRPAAPLLAGTRNDFDYRLTWTSVVADAVPLWRVQSVRSGAAPRGSRRVVVDFVPPGDVPVPAGGLADSGSADAAVPRALHPDVSASVGEVRDIRTEQLPGGRRFRTMFDYDPQGADAADLRVRLLGDDGGTASETWLWRWTR